MKIQHKQFNVDIKAIREDSYEIDFVFSSETEDRHGEVIDQTGWILDNYMKNPVVLFAHDHYTPAVGTVTDIFTNIVNGIRTLEGTIKFAVLDEIKDKSQDLAYKLWLLYSKGIMKMTSVGFMNLERETDSDGKLILRKNELHEVSLVNVGANQLALAKAFGDDNKDILDGIDELAKALYAKQNTDLNQDEVDEAIKAIEDNATEMLASIKGLGDNSVVKRLMREKKVKRIINTTIQSLLERKKDFK